MSKFLVEIKKEVKIRLDGYLREKEQLAKAAARVVELDELIKEAESELATFEERCPTVKAEEAKAEDLKK